MATSKQAMRREIEALRGALRRFADVPITEVGDVWIYVGKRDPSGYNLPPLHTEDFMLARVMTR